MQINLMNLDFIYVNNKVRARFSVLRPEIQWGGQVNIDVVIDGADSVDAMKAAAVAAAKELLSGVVSEISLEAVVMGPHPPVPFQRA